MVLACSDCEDKVCLPSALGVPPICACNYNASRCPPTTPDHDYCIIGSKESIGGKSSCQNCSSKLDGDAGKADCLVRLQGDHVNFGSCPANDCYEIK
jgi:hypothetical protein